MSFMKQKFFDQKEIMEKEHLLWGIQQDINKLMEWCKTPDEFATMVKRIQDHCIVRLDEKVNDEIIIRAKLEEHEAKLSYQD